MSPRVPDEEEVRSTRGLIIGGSMGRDTNQDSNGWGQGASDGRVQEEGERNGCPCTSHGTILPVAECGRRCYMRGKAWRRMENDEDKATCIIMGPLP